jgi:small subunit ribosomal protein S6
VAGGWSKALVSSRFVPAVKPIYDLILMLDLAATDEARAKIVTDTRATIVADGELVAEQPWGTRPLAYQIGHREQAEYHLMQFHGPPGLIASLEHTLRIDDGVVRHRIIKLAPGTPAPPAPPARAAVAAAPAPAAPLPDAPSPDSPPPPPPAEPQADDALAPA